MLPDVVDCAGALGERRLRRVSGEAQVDEIRVQAAGDHGLIGVARPGGASALGDGGAVEENGLLHGEAPGRREIVVRTAFTGLGGRDALEMVTRCLTLYGGGASA